MGFPGGVVSCQCRSCKWLGLIPGSGKSGEGNGNPFQYSCLENTMDKGVSWASQGGLKELGHDWVTEHTHTLKVTVIDEKTFFSIISFKLQ